MMKNIFSVFLLCYFSLAHADSDMQPISCAPNGIGNVLKEKVDPKGFWCHQATFSEGMINYLRNGEGAGPDEVIPTIQGCIEKSKGDPIEREKCISYVKNEQNFWIRCGEHANRMCRLNVGH